MSAANPEYRIDVGGVVIGVNCLQPDFAVGLANWFGQPSAPAKPHLTLDLELVPHDDAPDLPDSLLTTKILQPDGRFDISDGLITGHYDAATRHGRVQVKAVLITGLYPRILEQLFYQAFHSAREAMGVRTWLVHSSAVIRNGRGYLFVGPSEAGKSTVAKLSQGLHVLGDEMNLIIPTADGVDVAGTLFNGTFREKRAGRAPLAGVLLLSQAAAHRVVDAAPAAAVADLAAEIVPPVGLDAVPGPDTLTAMVESAAYIADKTTLKVLEFLPDAGFWDAIDAAFDGAGSGAEPG